MPIRRELKWHYPLDWPQISARIRFGRAQGQCEGCGRSHGTRVAHIGNGQWWDEERRVWRSGTGRVLRRGVAEVDLLARIRFTRVVLATAHRNHDPGHNRPGNPVAFCQRCHLIHDRDEHRRRRWMTLFRRRRWAICSWVATRNALPARLSTGSAASIQARFGALRGRAGRTILRGDALCGRVIQAKDPTLYTHVLGGEPERPLPNTPPHYNGAPGQDYLLGRVNPETGAPSVDVLRWGLIPSWAKDRKIAWRMINARAETVQTMPAFKKAYSKRRALLPVDGFYEWKKVGKEKQPYAIGMANGDPFTLAALWENWKDPESGEWVRTFTIVTTEANELVAELHDRMPVIVAAPDRERWLGDENPADLLRSYPAGLMSMWPVSQRVNSVRNDGPKLLERIDEDRDATDDVERVNEAAPRKPSNSE